MFIKFLCFSAFVVVIFSSTNAADNLGTIRTIIEAHKAPNRYKLAMQCKREADSKCDPNWTEDITFDSSGELAVVGCCIPWVWYCEQKKLGKLDSNGIIGVTQIKKAWGLLKALLGGVLGLLSKKSKDYDTISSCAEKCGKGTFQIKNFKVRKDCVKPGGISGYEANRSDVSSHRQFCIIKCMAPRASFHQTYALYKSSLGWLQKKKS